MKQGTFTGASGRNWAGYGAQVVLPAGSPDWQRNLITDPQTSGGLLVSCERHSSDEVLRVFREEGFAEAHIIGEMKAGAPLLTLS